MTSELIFYIQSLKSLKVLGENETVETFSADLWITRWFVKTGGGGGGRERNAKWNWSFKLLWGPKRPTGSTTPFMFPRSDFKDFSAVVLPLKLALSQRDILSSGSVSSRLKLLFRFFFLATSYFNLCKYVKLCNIFAVAVVGKVKPYFSSCIHSHASYRGRKYLFKNQYDCNMDRYLILLWNLKNLSYLFVKSLMKQLEPMKFKKRPGNWLWLQTKSSMEICLCLLFYIY